MIGNSIQVSGQPRTIVGVLPQEFEFPAERTALWAHDVITPPVQPGSFNLNVIGRLAPGTTCESLAAELSALTPRILERVGGSPAYARILDAYRPVIRSLEEDQVGDFAEPLWLLLGTMGIVLLIACANVANLLIVRAEGRERDLAVRQALGAGRGALVRTLLFTALITSVAAVGAGILPALKFSNPDVIGGLRSGDRTGSVRNPLTRNSLVIVQTGAALVLLVGAGLLLQSFRALRGVDPGYDVHDIFTFQMAPDPGEHGLSDAPSLARFHYGFMDRLAALPGVESVGLVFTLPLDEGAGETRVATSGYDGPPENAPRVRLTFADGDYFETMGIQFLAGETFERRDEPTTDVSAIVSRAAAEMLWPGEEPMGQVLRPASAPDAFPWITVGGVVEDVILADFRQQAPEPLIYLPLVGPSARTWGVSTPAYVVRSPRAERLAPEIRALIQEIAPGAPKACARAVPG